jgi:hypothetical protein
MTRKKGIPLVAIIGLAALAVSIPWGTVTGDNDGPARHCKPCGVYTGVDGGGATWNQTLIPCDPACNRMTAVVKFPNISPVGPYGTNNPWFPTTEFRSDLVGNLVRTGRNTWDFTWIGYGVEKPTSYGYALPLTFIIVMSGTQTFSDCGNYVTYNLTMAIWLPGDDADPADGIPDEGVEPFIALPGYPEPVFPANGTRLPLFPR